MKKKMKMKKKGRLSFEENISERFFDLIVSFVFFSTIANVTHCFKMETKRKEREIFTC